MMELYAGKILVDEYFYWNIKFIERMANVDISISPEIKNIADAKGKREKK